MLLLVSSIKLIAEIALLALVGRFLLGLLAGAKREGNFFYRMLSVVAAPFVKGVRVITPRAVLDRHVPLAAFLLLVLVWALVTFMKIGLCVEIGVENCR